MHLVGWIHNTYSWYRNNALVSTVNGLENYAITTEGTYKVEVRNSSVPGLTLMSRDYLYNPGSLEQDRLALIALYNSTNGALWKNRNSWQIPGNIGESPCGWFGITCSGGRVDRINLGSNNLVGSIPAEIGNLYHLQDLAVNNNLLNGGIPSQLGKLSSLKNLNLGTNQLTGSIPSELGNLNQLETFFLQSNRLSGSIPIELGNLSRLIFLWISYNQLSGNIPDQLNKLPQLQQLLLNDNQLQGSIPSSLGNLGQLKMLSLANNQLVGTIPNQLSNLSKLEHLFLSLNQLTGSIPSELRKLSLARQLSLGQNLLSGEIPSELGQMSALEYLDLNTNNLSGTIPPSLGSLTKLLSLNLEHNSLSGAIPSELGNLLKLNVFFVRFNELSGAIPSSLGNLTGLTNLNVQSNRLTGIIPSELGNLTNLIYLNLNYNRLSGNIPAQLGTLSNLQELGLSGNLLTGTIPALTNIPVSAYVNFSSNGFTFDGLESNSNKIDYYVFQSNIPIEVNRSTLSVNAGGTLARNTYKWFKNGTIVATIIGNNSFTMTGTGTYFVQITNNLATGLTLNSVSHFYNDALPVNLVNFIVKQTSTGNLLKWSTTSETNNAGFEIERSIDAKLFEKIGYVDGKGESATLQSYQFSDQNPLPISYYRLKQLS